MGLLDEMFRAQGGLLAGQSMPSPYSSGGLLGNLQGMFERIGDPERQRERQMLDYLMRNREFDFRKSQADQAQRNIDRSFGHTVSESNRAQGNTDRSFGLQERQFQADQKFDSDPNNPGGQRFIKGGAGDPEYIKSISEARQKPREFSVSDITKLSEEGGKFANIKGFADTFQDRFAGYKAPVIGNAAMTAGRFLPESIVGPNMTEGATWWQGYDRFKNVVRNDLFGSALTTNEQAAFERADINAGMTPEQIRKNLATQQAIAENGLKRKANALIQSGFDPKAIGATFGLKLEDIGIAVEPKRGGAQQPAPQSGAPPAGSSRLPAGVTPEQAISEAKAAVAAGKNREAIAQRLRSWGLDPAGL